MGVREWWDERSQDERIAVWVGGLLCLVPVLGLLATVVVSGVISTFVLGLGEQPEQRTPQVEFDFEVGDDAETVRITHFGGDSVAADRLRIVVEGRRQAWPGSGQVSAGDRATVDAGPGSSVRVAWQGPEGSRTLATFRMPP